MTWLRTLHFLMSVIAAAVLYPLPLGYEIQEQLVVWNVGQGQWVTWIMQTQCEHFDMGGERADWKLIRRLCGSRRNKVHFSHWDLDHINFVTRARGVLPNICIATYPVGPPPKPYKLKMMQSLRACSDEKRKDRADASDHSAEAKLVPQLTQQAFGIGRDRWTRLRAYRRRARARPDTNVKSQIYAIKDVALIPGDSTKKQEQVWSENLAGSGRMKWLILGHHGSQTSTSLPLLQNLRHLKLAIASCRRKRYGHPHASVVKRLHMRGVSVITTEDWGAIRLALPVNSKLPSIRLFKPQMREKQ